MTSSRVLNGTLQSPNVYTLRRHAGRSSLAEIADAWRALAASLPRRWFHHLPEWYECQLDALADDASEIRFYTVHRGRELEAVIPLRPVRLRVMGTMVSVLSLPFDDHIPFGDIVCRPDADMDALGAALLDHLERDAGVRWDLLVLPRVLDGAAGARLVAGAPLPNVAAHAQGHCDYVACADGDDLSRAISGKLRRDLRRRGNKLRQIGAVEYVVSNEGEALHQAYERFLAVEASGWKGRHGAGTAIALHPRYTHFYRTLLDRFADSSGAEISELHVGGRCVAAQLALVADGAWFLMKTGYDEELSAVAPGNLLFEHTLERLTGAANVDEANLVSDAAWHQTWNPQRHAVATHFVANRTLRGLATVALLRAKERVQHWRDSRRRDGRPAETTGARPRTITPKGADGSDRKRQPAGIP